MAPSGVQICHDPVVPKYVQRQRRRILVAAAIVLGLMSATVLAIGEWVTGTGFALLAVSSGAAARAEVATTPEGIVIQNPFRRRRLTWDQVAGASVDRLPQVHLVDGSTVRVEGVEPYPRLFPTRTSQATTQAFVDAVNSRT